MAASAACRPHGCGRSSFGIPDPYIPPTAAQPKRRERLNRNRGAFYQHLSLVARNTAASSAAMRYEKVHGKRIIGDFSTQPRPRCAVRERLKAADSKTRRR